MEKDCEHSLQASTNPICCLIKTLRNLFENATTCCPKEIPSILSSISIDHLDEKYIHFDPHQYTRVLVAVNKHFSIILNCWSKGQVTPLHNHGKSKVCSWIQVLRGNFYVSSTMSDGSIQRIDVPEGENALIPCEMGDHIAGNASETDKCISLHLYSPPYLECCFTEKHGPSCTCTQEKLKKFIPVIHCNDRQHYYKENEELETVALFKSRPIFSNFRKMVEILRKEIVVEPEGIHSPENIKHIKDILSCMNFNPKEWEQYAKFAKGRYTRNLIAYDEKFTILLLCWEKGQKSPIHDHSGSNCWVKVLDGQVEECLYKLGDDGVTTILRSQRTFQPGAIAYINDSYGVHKMGNANEDRVAISLHIYSPAYHECFIFDEEKPEKKKVSISTAYGARYPFMERQIPVDCSSPSPQSMKSFICRLDQEFTSSDVDSAKINEVVDALVYSEQQWENYIHFSPEQYTRNLLGFTDHYSAVLVCWCPGQQTPIHEHGECDERRVWIKVLTGTLQIQYFEDSFNQLVPSTKPPVVVKEGECVMLHDRTLGQHRTFNPSSTENCISLHIYSPPYVECSFVEQTGNTKLIPVAYCTKEINQYRAKLQEEDLELQYKFRSMVFSDFASFSNLINKYFENGIDKDTDHLEIVKMLKHIHFHPKEWESRPVCSGKQYTRSLVAFGYHYSIHLICWKPTQKNVIHNHNESWSFFKVLAGTLDETTYDTPEEKGKPMKVKVIRKLKPLDVVRHLPKDIHRVVNSDPKENAFSLHIYSPPLKYCQSFSAETGETETYECNHHFVKKSD